MAYDVSAILPVLAAASRAGAGATGASAATAPGRSSQPPGLGSMAPIGPQFAQSMETRKGKVAASLVSLVGNTLIANKALGNPLDLPWWLSGGANPNAPGAQGQAIAPVIAPQTAIDTRKPPMSRSSSNPNPPPPPQASSGGGGGPLAMLGMGGMMGGGGGGEGGGGMDILGMLGLGGLLGGA